MNPDQPVDYWPYYYGPNARIPNITIPGKICGNNGRCYRIGICKCATEYSESQASHEADWRENDSILSDKEKERGYTGYICQVCYRTMKCPPGAFPRVGERHS